MKRLFLAAAGGIALSISSAPVAAQTVASEVPTAEEMEAISGLIGNMFGEAEPLTAEQEERLPLAVVVANQLMPDGTMARMMSESFGPLMGDLTGDVSTTPALQLAMLLGLGPLDLTEVEDKNLEEALALLDPDGETRQGAINDAFLTLLTEVVDETEPSYRAGLARAYAIRFTQEELLELSRFFATETGAKYAADSYVIYSDPQVISSMNEMVPAVMQRMPQLMETITEVNEKYDTTRSFSELTDDEQSRLAELLGVSREELAGNEPFQPDTEAELEETLEEA